ncbi:MAG TPA: energy transducer TonB [Acidobacteriaceae bacterium]|nr:energy transducer TonB [Acidobacteriaceae bacterium]
MKINRVVSQINRYRVTSLLIHISVLAAIVVIVKHLPSAKATHSANKVQVAQHVILSLPGSVEAGSPRSSLKDIAKPKSDMVSQSAPPPPPHHGRLSRTPQTGEGISGQSAWGKGEITIAYPKFFPHPAPDLSSMRPGTEGDVVLTALIDEQGKISHLTLLSGIDPAIDHTVIQTVSLWTFSPATKDGLPISSRQELHFHFRSTHEG